MIAAIERIVRADCEAARSPRDPVIELYESYPLTDNDAAVTEKVTGAFVDHFGADRVETLAPVPASEDFSIIPTAFGIPYSYWGVGGFTEGQQVFPNHNPDFGPAMQPTLKTGTEAAVVAVSAYLGKGCSHDHGGGHRKRRRSLLVRLARPRTSAKVSSL